MTKYEKQSIDYAKRFKSWEHICISKDAYLSGYRQALEDVQRGLTEEVEVEFENGDHQLTKDCRNDNE